MVKIIFNTVLGLVLIFIWSRFVNLGQIFSTLQGTSFIYLGPIFLFMLLSPVLRAIRLKIFLAEIPIIDRSSSLSKGQQSSGLGRKKISLKDLIFLNGVAMILNFFIPIRAGEIAKGIYLNTQYKLNLGKSVIWVFLDRFVDFLVVLLLTTALFFIVPTSLSIIFIIVITIILSTVLLITYLAIHKANLTRKLVKFLKGYLIEKHIKIYFDKFSSFILESFSILDRHPKDLFLMILVTILAYGADAAIWYFTFLSLRVHQDFFKMYLGQLLSALTYLIPAAPGYVGSAEASGLLIFSGVFGIEVDLASAMTVLFHITSAVFIIIYGLISIFSLKIDLGMILQKALKRR